MSDIDRPSGPTDADPKFARARVPSPEAGGMPVVDLRRWWRQLHRHRFLILAVTSVTVFLALAVSISSPSLYVATTQIRIDTRPLGIIDVKDVATPAADPSYFETEYVILQGAPLATRVIKAMRLYNVPRFLSDTGGVGPRRALAGDDPTRDLVRPYLSRLSVTPVENSRLVGISYASTSPELAAEISRAHAREFVRMNLHERREANATARRMLENNLTELRDRIGRSEKALNDFRRAHPVLAATGDDDSVLLAGLKQLTTNYVSARSDRLMLQSELAIAKSREYGSLAAVQQDPVYEKLREEFETLRSEYARLAQFYKEKYPEMVRLGARIKDVKARMTELRHQAAGTVEAQLLSAKDKEVALANEFDKQRQAAIDADDAVTQYRLLVREADTQRDLYKALWSRMQEIGVAENLRQTNVSIVSLAEVPDRPVIAPLKRNLLRGLFLGLLLGVMAAFAVDHFDGTVKTGDDLEELCGAPLLAVVPTFPGTEPRSALPFGPWARTEAPAVALPADAGGVTEAFRTLSTALLLGSPDRPPRVIQVVSGQYREGKTLIAVNTALALARNGARVLLIDANLRRPGCHRLLSVASWPGLVDHLNGAALESCVTAVPLGRVAEASSLASPGANAGGAPGIARGAVDLLPAGTALPNAAELLGSDRMRQTIEAVRGAYDYVVIDSPPLLSVADGVLLSRLVDGLVLVMRAGVTRAALVRQTVGRLQRVGGRVVGCVLDDVDPVDGAHYYGYYVPEEAFEGEAAAS